MNKCSIFFVDVDASYPRGENARYRVRTLLHTNFRVTM